MHAFGTKKPKPLANISTDRAHPSSFSFNKCMECSGNEELMVLGK